MKIIGTQIRWWEWFSHNDDKDFEGVMAHRIEFNGARLYYQFGDGRLVLCDTTLEF